ncbi:PREDICTED: uncharacterized protein LOC109133099 [Camelina sativa]|uniref:Uncharacterized protein LOC109133099 n=1 Tax=Camelina sativa TaxID=90675 RepID=A0ABM1RR23_CAMSA|nr:PREDICTED: uncharacterized protein LOC109133099 [Camelina sativa]
MLSLILVLNRSDHLLSCEFVQGGFLEANHHRSLLLLNFHTFLDGLIYNLSLCCFGRGIYDPHHHSPLFLGLVSINSILLLNHSPLFLGVLGKRVYDPILAPPTIVQAPRLQCGRFQEKALWECLCFLSLTFRFWMLLLPIIDGFD